MYLPVLCCHGVIVRTFFVKVHLWFRYGSDTRRGKRGQNTPVICTLDRKNLETCYNAIQQLCLQAKPHIFVYTEVFVAVFIFHRSHGEETNIALVVVEYSVQGSLVTL